MKPIIELTIGRHFQHREEGASDSSPLEWESHHKRAAIAHQELEHDSHWTVVDWGNTDDEQKTHEETTIMLELAEALEPVVFSFAGAILHQAMDDTVVAAIKQLVKKFVPHLRQKDISRTYATLSNGTVIEWQSPGYDSDVSIWLTSEVDLSYSELETADSPPSHTPPPTAAKKFLVAIDDSDISAQAFDAALTLANALGAELIILNVLDIFDSDSPRQSLLPIDGFSRKVDAHVQKSYEQQWADYVHQYESVLKEKQAIARDLGVDATTLYAYGRPETVICNTASTQSVDLIVVGSHGRKGLNEMLLGSVSNYVMHHAPCSVMVVHPKSATGNDAQLEKLATATI